MDAASRQYMVRHYPDLMGESHFSNAEAASPAATIEGMLRLYCPTGSTAQVPILAPDGVSYLCKRGSDGSLTIGRDQAAFGAGKALRFASDTEAALYMAGRQTGGTAGVARMTGGTVEFGEGQLR